MKLFATLCIFGGLFATQFAQAGTVKVVTYPVRHPVKSVRNTAHFAWKVIW